jgi:hypothetical protein
MRGKADGWIGLGLLIFCAGMSIASRGLPVAPYGTMGPARMPNLILTGLAILSGLLAFKGFRAPAPVPAGASRTLAARIARSRNILVSFGLFFLFALLSPILGYVVSGILFLLALQVALGPKTWRLAPAYVGVALGVMLFLFLVFRCMLMVILPESDYALLRAIEDAMHVATCGPWEFLVSFWP